MARQKKHLKSICKVRHEARNKLEASEKADENKENLSAAAANNSENPGNDKRNDADASTSSEAKLSKIVAEFENMNLMSLRLCL